MDRSKIRFRIVGIVGLLGVLLGGVVVPVESAGGAVAPAAASRSVPRLSAALSDPSGMQDRFGDSVAVSGGTAVVAAEQTVTGPGAAYIYEKSAAGWPTSPTVTLRDPLGHMSDQFGFSVAISGTTIVVGALNIPQFGPVLPGAAYVYEKGPAGWPTTPTATLMDPGPPPQPFPGSNNLFGWSVAVSGKTILVGAWQTGFSAGAAYIYDKTSARWPAKPTATLADPANIQGDRFGWSVAVSGRTALVGSLETNHGAGAAYIYEKTARRWSTAPNVALQSPTGAQVDEFGHSVSVSGTTAIVGADGPDSQIPGAAYIYQRHAGSWPTTPTVALHDPVATNQIDRFGWSVGVSGNTIAIGAPDIPAAALYLYVKGPGGWPTTPTASASDPGPNEGFFTFSLAISRKTIVAGALTTDNGVGAAYIYESQPRPSRRDLA